MCYFKDIESIRNINEIQATIVRTIARQIGPFDCRSLSEEVKNELRGLQVEESIVESYRVDSMIRDTLEQMVEIGSIAFFNHVYIPTEDTEMRVRYAFA